MALLFNTTFLGVKYARATQEITTKQQKIIIINLYYNPDNYFFKLGF